MRSLLRRIGILGCVASLASVVALASPARADCTACGTMLVTCGQTVLTTFQPCITAARTRMAVQLCITAASQGLTMCQRNFSTCIASCTPAT